MNNRWRNVEDRDIRLVELLPKTQGEGVEGSLRGTVGRERREGDYCDVRGRVDDRCRGLLLEEERQKGVGQVHETRKVERYFIVELGQVDGLGFGEVVRLLQPGVEEDAIEVWEAGCDAGYFWSVTICLAAEHTVWTHS